MKKKFETIVTFREHLLHVDGYIKDGLLVKLDHVYLYKTDIEILSSLACDQYEELTDLILELCTAQ